MAQTSDFEANGANPNGTAVASALARGQRYKAEILDGADMASSYDLGLLLGVSRETVNAWRMAGSPRFVG